LFSDAKNRAMASLCRDYFEAKKSGYYPALRQPTQTPFIAGPLAKIWHKD
jgi:hypothetical protein